MSELEKKLRENVTLPLWPDVGQMLGLGKNSIDPGDVIVKFDGKEIKQYRDLTRVLDDTPVGKQAAVLVIRKGKEETKTVTIGRLPEHIALFRQGNTARYSGDYDRAIVAYDEAIRLNPNYAVAFINRGLAYEQKGDNDRAIADYDEAIRLDPKDAVFFCYRGKAKLKIKNASGRKLGS